MKNKERFAKKILEIACRGESIAFNKKENKVTNCGGLLCNDCLFGIPDRGCADLIKVWSEQEYVKPSIDWSKIPVDTPILVTIEGTIWKRRYFARFENGKVYAWNDGKTSWSSVDSFDVSAWEYAELAEE